MSDRWKLLGVIAFAAVLIFWQVSTRPQSNAQRTPVPEVPPPGNVPAAESKEYSFDVGDAVTLDFSQAAGNIVVFVGPPRKASIIVTRKTVGADLNGAQQDLATYTLEPQQTADRITFKPNKPSPSWRQVDYKVTAPPNTSIRVADGNGSYTFNGLRGDVSLSGPKLDVALADVRGNIQIQSDTGNVKMADTKGSISVRSGNAPVQLTRSVGTSILVSTASNTTLIDSGAQITATFQITNGDLSLTRFSAQTLNANVPGGQIRISESTSQITDLATRDGVISLFRTAVGKLHASTLSGALSFDQVQGDFEIKTQQGGITISEAAASGLNIAGGTGNVVFYGALPPGGQHAIKTTSGNIEVYVVKESAFQLDASTKGKITIEPPFTLQSEEKSAGRWRGVINQGTMSLVLSSASGNIVISSQQLY